MFRPALATLVLTLAAHAAGAQERDDSAWHGLVASGARVRIYNYRGAVTVRPAPAGEMTVVGTPRGGSTDAMRAEVHETSDGWVVCVAEPGIWCDAGGMHSVGGVALDTTRHDAPRVDLLVRVPAGVRLSASSVSGDVTMTAVEGDVTARTVTGDVRLSGLRVSRARAATVSGHLSLAFDQLTGNEELRFASVSGDIALDLPAETDADLQVATVDGSIQADIAVTGERADANGLSGRLGRGGRALRLLTVSGDLRVRGAQ